MNPDVFLIGIGCVFGAVAGFVVCACALTSLRPPPKNERRHELGRRLGWSHPEWR